MNDENEAASSQETTPPAPQTESAPADQAVESTEKAKPARKRTTKPRRAHAPKAVAGDKSGTAEAAAEAATVAAAAEETPVTPALEAASASAESAVAVPAPVLASAPNADKAQPVEQKNAPIRKRPVVDPAAARRVPEEWTPGMRTEKSEASVAPAASSDASAGEGVHAVDPAERDTFIAADRESSPSKPEPFVAVPPASAEGADSAAEPSQDVANGEAQPQQPCKDSTASEQSQLGQNSQGQQEGGRWSRFQRNRDRRNRDRRNRFHHDGDVQGQPLVQDNSGQQQPQPPPPPRPQLPPIHLREIEDKPLEEINKMLESFMTPEEIAGIFRKHDVINGFIRAYLRRGGTVTTNGVIEITSDGYGFLRSQKASYLPCPEDVYVAPQYVRRFNLRTGDFVEGPIRDPRERPDRGKEKFLALGRIDSVNGRPPAEWRRVIPFENLTPIFPDRRIYLEVAPEEISMRILNIVSPIGFGQRGIIVAPPRTGKTVLMQKMANAITENHPDAYLIVLLIDERPEEVTDMQRNTKAHVFASTFDEEPERHAQVAEMVIEMSKRMVEAGKDVIILLDSITRLARAYNTLQPHSGKILSGGVDATSLHKPKRFFGAARNIEGGGSLTIIATALIETGSKMDEVIFEEFKGTGNMEVVLDRQISDKRIFPAINIEASGTRKEDLLFHPDELNRVWILRRALNGVPPVDAIEMVIKRMKATRSNAEFLMNVKE